MSHPDPTDEPASCVECACESCHCVIPPGKGVLHDGKLYCSATCAYDCTPATCVCVHNGCGES
jgi:hypothetical protein